MKPDFAERLDEIDWSGFRTAYGNAAVGPVFQYGRGNVTNWRSVPDQLLRLAGPDPKAALEASHQLWCGLCHQHAYVSSAALPALPFLLDVLDGANDGLSIEILDIVAGIAICAQHGHGDPKGDWVRSLRQCLAQERGRFQRLASHPNEEFHHWAEWTLEALAPDAVVPEE